MRLKALALAMLALPVVALAEHETPDIGGKLLLTGGVTQIEGAGGGRLTPWALIGGYGSDGQ